MTWTKMPSLLAWPLVTGLLMVLSGCGGTLAIEVNESSGSSSGNISSSTSSGYSSSGSSYSSSSSSSSSTGGFGSYEDTTLTELQQQLIAQYRTLRDLPLQVGPATRASSSQFNALAQNHLRRSVAISYPAVVASSTSSSSSGSSYITTVLTSSRINVASDKGPTRMRTMLETTDDDLWFISSVSTNKQELNLDILRLNPSTAAINHLVDFKVVGDSPYVFDGVKGLQIVKNTAGDFEKLAFISQRPHRNYALGSEAYLNREVQVNFIGASNLSAPQNSPMLEFRGDVLATHRLGEQLIVVSRMEPYLDGLTTSGASLGSAVDANEAMIAQTTSADLIPEFTGTEACYSNPDIAGFAANSLIKIIAVNLQTETIDYSDCIAMRVDGLYLDGSSLYTWASEAGQQTVLQKYSFSSNGLDFNAWGVVPGAMKDNYYTPTKFINIFNNTVRIITTDPQGQHHFTILAATENDYQMQVVGSIPNNINSEAFDSQNIVFGAAFDGDRIFINSLIDGNYGLSATGDAGLTYVVNTADPTTPVIERTFTLSDYASVITPLSDDYLFVVSRSGVSYYDAKMQLLDVSDASATSVVSSSSFSAPSGANSSGGPIANSPVNISPETLGIAKVNDSEYRVAVPLDFAGRVNDEVSARSDVILFDITGLGAAPAMTLVGQVPSHTYTCPNSGSEGYGCIYNYLRSKRKALVRGDAVYYLYEGVDNLGETGVSSVKWDDFSGLVDRVLLSGG